MDARDPDQDTRSRPIGVFDSGLGGLTVVKELVRQLPQEAILYFGDTARVPYGTKSPDTIRRFARDDRIRRAGRDRRVPGACALAVLAAFQYCTHVAS